MSTIGENIKRIRKEKGLTQKQLGDMCKPPMADSAIRRYEIGRANPKLATIEKIAPALKVPLNAILDGNWQFYTEEINNSLITVTEGLAQVIDLGEDLMRDKIIENFNKANPEGKQKIFEYSQDISENPKYQNDSE